MILVLKPNGKYQEFSNADDNQVISILNKMSYKERCETEIAIYFGQWGDTRKFRLYKDGTYEDLSEGDTRQRKLRGRLMRFESAQIISGNLYNLCGEKVQMYSDGETGVIKERSLTSIGVEYQIEKSDGTMILRYDADLEVIGPPQKKKARRTISKQKRNPEMER